MALAIANRHGMIKAIVLRITNRTIAIAELNRNHCNGCQVINCWKALCLLIYKIKCVLLCKLSLQKSYQLRLQPTCNKLHDMHLSRSWYYPNVLLQVSVMVRWEERWIQRPVGCWVIVLAPCFLDAAVSIRASQGTV